jgi:hypothetical protein
MAPDGHRLPCGSCGGGQQIVFGTGVDPIASGLVASLSRPGANLTGSTILSSELGPKRLQLLRELLPNAALFGLLADPAAPDIQSQIADLQAAASWCSIIVQQCGKGFQAMTVFTIGYQKLAPARLAEIAADLQALVIDVRGKPWSRKPGFHRTSLQRLLGERYLWMGDTLSGPPYHGAGVLPDNGAKEVGGTRTAILVIKSHQTSMGRGGNLTEKNDQLLGRVSPLPDLIVRYLEVFYLNRLYETSRRV